MNSKITKIKALIKNECVKDGKIDPWFYSTHLLAVEKFALFLLKKLLKANKEIVLLGVWLHDLQRIRGIKGDHAKVGAREAKKVMLDYGYDEKAINSVQEIILSHTCEGSPLPKLLESKILASADAMSHYVNDFYLTIATTRQRDVQQYKKWAFEKLDRDYNKKIYFGFAKKEIKKQHQIIKAFLSEC